MYATKLFSQSSEPSQAADGDNDGKDDVPEYVYKALTFEEISDLLQNSNFNAVAIRNWHKAFYNECPSGEQLVV